jgi:hypothetical protein
MEIARSLAIHLPAVPYPDHQDDQVFILDRIQDAVVSLSNAVQIVTGELLAAGRTRVRGQMTEPRDQPLPILPGD